jgi:cytoskeletal protein CcmA (bactofilin family)
MLKALHFVPALAVAILLTTAGIPAVAQQFGESVVQRGHVQEDVYLAGADVSVQGRVDGDVTAAGGRVGIEDVVNGDVFAVGGSVDIRARVKDDVRISGGEVTVRGAVGDDLLAAGGTLVVGPEASIGGRAWLTGGRLDIAGRVGRELKAAGGDIRINGEILGDANLMGDNIELGPGAKIHGQLRYRSHNAARIDPQAQVTGTIVRQSFEDMPRKNGRAGGGVFMLLTLFTAALILFLLFPRFATATARGVGEAPWISLGLGLAMLASTPFVIFMLCASVVGLWLGLMLAAIYFVLLLLGYLTGVLFLADAGLRRMPAQGEAGKGRVIAALGLVLLALVLLRLLPAVGAIAGFVLLLFGLGALTRALWRRYTAAGV